MDKWTAAQTVKVWIHHARWGGIVRYAQQKCFFVVSRVHFIVLVLNFYVQSVAMEAVIPAKWIEEHRPRLIEGRVYTIHYFEVCNARAIYRPVDHPYMARFTKHTRITQVNTEPPKFPLYACSITPFPVLRARVGTKEQMAGLICYFYFQTTLFLCIPRMLTHWPMFANLQMLWAFLLSAHVWQSNQQNMECNH